MLLQLLAMKKEEREKQLFEAEKQQAKSRPKSARAARSAFGEKHFSHKSLKETRKKNIV